MSDPSDVEKLDTLRYLIGGDVEAVAVPRKEILKAIDKYYAEDEERLKSMINDKEVNSVEILVSEDEETNVGAMDDDTIPIIRLATKIILDAYKMKASDIHLEPMEKRYRIRYRIDGSLREVEGPPKYLQANFTSRIKIMSRMDITEKRIPQDGRIRK